MAPASPYPLRQSHADGSHKTLAGAAVTWFAVAASGQSIFVLHILMLYGVPLFTGDYEAWSRMMPKGLVEGDIAGKAATIVHVLIAAVLTASGILQLIPAIRTRYRGFHRWNGRVYLVPVPAASLTGLWMERSVQAACIPLLMRSSSLSQNLSWIGSSSTLHTGSRTAARPPKASEPVAP